MITPMVKNCLIACCLLFAGALAAQEDNPVLFTVGGDPVHLDEFRYIYTKTNGNSADFSKASVEEYLDLYVKFKLKVKKARELQLDTIPALRKELEGYRQQLADSYLINKEVTEKLVREAYERSKEDVNISHIFFAADANTATAEDTLAAYQKALMTYDKLQNGADFEVLAAQVSDDQSARDNKGNIGFLNVLFPSGFYPLETAAYSLRPGEISKPVRTPAGYHIVRLESRRPARGEVEAAHILLRTDATNGEAVKKTIDSLYQAIQDGAGFEALARTFSEDKRTAPRNGYIGFIGINQFEPAFENAVFAIEQDGAISAPVQSQVGWHLIKRISKKGVQPYEIAKSSLEARIKRDARFEAAKEGMIEQIKREEDFIEFDLVLQQFIATQNDTFFTFRWRAPQPASQEILFTLGDNKATLGDFADYLERAARQRMQMARTTKINDGIQSLYRDYVDEFCLRYEERKLTEKYPEFRALMREYEEGILLFEVTKMKVWDKAAQDTTGLREFFKTIEGKYRWNDRAETTLYSIPADKKEMIEAVRAFAAGNRPEAVQKKFNVDGQQVVAVQAETLEKDKLPRGVELPTWTAGALTITKLDRNRNQYSFRKVEKIIPAQDKTLQEARGYVIADYQDQLEKQWVEQLRQEYPVRIEKKVLNTIIQ